MWKKLASIIKPKPSEIKPIQIIIRTAKGTE